jgi:hypothetical protein
MKKLIVAALLIAGVSAYAQNGIVEMLRQDLKTEKTAIMTASLPLTQKESDAFWPIYREYGHELTKLGDRRIEIIKQIAEKYDKMDDKTAEKLAKESFKIVDDRTSLLKKYFNKVAKAIGPVKAGRFLQIESQMLTLVDAQVIEQVPLIKTGAPAGGEKK